MSSLQCDQDISHQHDSEYLPLYASLQWLKYGGTRRGLIQPVEGAHNRDVEGVKMGKGFSQPTRG